MKRTTTLLALILVFVATAFAGPIEPEKALEIANSFWSSSVSGKKAVRLQLVHDNEMAKSGSRQTIEKGDAQYYIIAPEEGNGFIIVSGDDKLSPIVGYSTNSTMEEMPIALTEWLTLYSSYVDDVRAGEIEPSITNATGKAIAPILKTSWNQSAPYNNLCPTVNGQRTPTGCTATAMAQVMKHHNWPEKPLRPITWTNTNTGKEETVDITKNTYDWANMLNHYRSGYNNTQAKAVAQLMFDVGRAIKSSYSPSGTGSNDIYVAKSLVNVFNYSPEIRIVKRCECTYDEFYSIIRENLEANQPIVHSGYGPAYASGHAFVCDGIDANNLVHIDWGWDGAFNGYFDIGSMAPGGSGIGGGEERYNVGQSLVVGIRPRTAEDSNRNGDPTLYIHEVVNPTSNATVEQYTANFSGGNAKFRTVVQFLNWSHSTVNTEYGLSITSADGTFNKRITGGTISIAFEKATGYYVDITVNNSNTKNSNYLKEGTYSVEVYCKDADGNQVKMKGENNHLTLEVGAKSAKLYKTMPDIEVAGFKFRVTPVRRNDKMTFDVALRNNNTCNATVVVVPIVNRVSNGAVVKSDTLANKGSLIQVYDNTDFLVTYTAEKAFTGSGEHFISFAYDLRNAYTDHDVAVDKKKLKSISGKSQSFEIEATADGPIPTVTTISTPDIIVGRKLTLSATIQNLTETSSPFTGTLGLFAEKGGKKTLLAEKSITNLAENATTTLSFASEDYFPALEVGTYEAYVCELVNGNWKRISSNGSYNFKLNQPETGLPYVCDKIVVNGNNTAAIGDSVDVKVALNCMYGDFEGLIRINVLSGIKMVLRSGYIPVSMTAENVLEQTIRCMCGTTAPTGDWTVSIAYYDNNKRQLGHVSSNTMNFPDNGLFTVVEAGTGVESIAGSGIKVTTAGRRIDISGAAENALFNVTAIDGKRVYNGTATSIAVGKGLYIVTIEQNGEVRATKVLVK